jgi:hypothetical protein
MAFWNQKPDAERDETPPTPPPPPVDDRLEKLTEAVSTLAEHQLRSATPQSAPAPAAPPVYDVSDDEYTEAYYSGDPGRIQQVENIRRNAVAERLRREMGGQLAVGMGAINKLTAKTYLTSNEFYRTDAQFKRSVDNLVREVEKSGALLGEDTLQWIVDKVTGEQFDRLHASRLERDTRAKREASDAGPGGRGRDPRTLPPDLQENYGLSEEAMKALSHLNRGRGRTPDEFAQELPARRVRMTDVDANGRFRERVEKRSYANFGDTLKQREWAETEMERQRAIMCGEISPFTPVTPRK